ncbi:MAG: phage head-tail connector protein [Rhizomicrobium sp.]
MATYDLCALADLKAWLGRTDTNSDALLAALLTRTSRQIYAYLQRGLILPRTVSETRDGTGGSTMVLRQWPAISVASLTIGNLTIPERTSNCGAGWAMETWDGTPPGRAQTLSLCGYAFGLSFPGAANAQNVQIVYQTGYEVSAEPQTVANGVATVLAPYGAWASDMGVSYADGAALVAVTGSPAIGQYQLTPGQPGSYTFNAGDEGAAILISYGFIPADLADACIELAGERYKYSQRIGETTHSLGGNETVGFNTTRFTPLVAALLQPYRDVLPI